MAKAIYLISPAPDYPSYFNSEVFQKNSGRPVASVVNLALPTVAALATVDFVGITGNISQWAHVREVAREFRERGKVVLIGGPQATLRAEAVRPHCDILVRGELEEIATELFDDLRSGNWKAEYVGTEADLSKAALPRLDLYPNDRTLTGAIQMSRGCPFRCEFCEITRYHGRKQRHKTVSRVVQELEQLYEFAMSTPIPVFTAVTLFAHVTTPLYERFEQEDRIVPKGMTREELFQGLRPAHSREAPRSRPGRDRADRAALGPSLGQTPSGANHRATGDDVHAVPAHLPAWGVLEAPAGETRRTVARQFREGFPGGVFEAADREILWADRESPIALVGWRNNGGF